MTTDSSNSPAACQAMPPGLLPGAALLAGAAIMVIEISGNRLIAPVYGNTIYTWTALIGVVLVALSVGGYLGGRLADNNPRPGMVGLLLGAAGATTCFLPALAVAVAGVVNPAELLLGPLFLSSVMFLLPGLLLGAVGPYCVKLLSVTRSDHLVGRSAGLVSMMGSLGSFVGTFATGFYLISAFDIRHIIVACGLLLCVAALPFWRLARGGGGALAAMLLPALFGAGISSALDPASRPGTVFAKNTFYHLVRVVDVPQAGRTTRVLMLDSTEEGGINLDDDSLALPYQQYWRLMTGAREFRPERALFLGAGAFGMPRHFAAHWPRSTVDVAEIDPEVIAAGRKFFRLDDSPRVRAHAADARGFLTSQADASYDFIFGDAYNGVSYIPPHLVTTEFFGMVATKLKPDGVYMMNVIGALRGPAGELTSGVLGGIRDHFPHIAAFTVHRASPETRQNIILLASKQPLDRILAEDSADRKSLVPALRSTRVPDVLLTPLLAAAKPFTDHRNPVDRIIARSLLHAQTLPTASF